MTQIERSKLNIHTQRDCDFFRHSNAVAIERSEVFFIVLCNYISYLLLLCRGDIDSEHDIGMDVQDRVVDFSRRRCEPLEAD